MTAPAACLSAKMLSLGCISCCLSIICTYLCLTRQFGCIFSTLLRLFGKLSCCLLFFGCCQLLLSLLLALLF